MESRVGRVIINKFGETSINDISTGCKVILLALTHSDYCISNLEMGQNVIEFALDNIQDSIDIHILCKNDIDMPSGNRIVTVDGEQLSIDKAALIMDKVL